MEETFKEEKRAKREKQPTNINSLLKHKKRQKRKLDNYPVGEVNTVTKTEPTESEKASEKPKSCMTGDT